MIRLSKLTDYGFVLLTRFACSDGEVWLTARDLADATGLPLPTVSKLLKVFSKHGILDAQRGVYGGYRLARQPEDIRILDVIELVDGPIAITDCACEADTGAACSIEAHCPTRPHWQKITERIRTALSDLTLVDMAEPLRTGAEANVALTAHGCGGHCAPAPGQPCRCGNDNLDFSGDKQ
jgi:FeS assembly SUF system regulator